MVKMEEKKILIVMRAGDHQCIHVQVPNGMKLELLSGRDGEQKQH